MSRYLHNMYYINKFSIYLIRIQTTTKPIRAEIYCWNNHKANYYRQHQKHIYIAVGISKWHGCICTKSEFFFSLVLCLISLYLVQFSLVYLFQPLFSMNFQWHWIKFAIFPMELISLKLFFFLNNELKKNLIPIWNV